MFTAITLVLNASTVIFNENSSPIGNIRVRKEPSSPEIKVNETEVIIPVQVLIQNLTATIGTSIYYAVIIWRLKKRFTCAVNISQHYLSCSNTNEVTGLTSAATVLPFSI